MIIESFFLFLLCRTREEVLLIDIAKYHCNRPEIAISFPNEEKTTVIGLNTFLLFCYPPYPLSAHRRQDKAERNS